MSSVNYQIELCLRILEEHFGEIVKNTAKQLFDVEQCTLAVLTKILKNLYSYSSKDTKYSLLILIQHDCVIIKDNAKADANSLDPMKHSVIQHVVEYTYSMNVLSIINRIRFPLLLTTVKDTYGDMGVVIMEHIIEQGRANVKSILENASVVVYKNSHVDDETEAEDTSEQDKEALDERTCAEMEDIKTQVEQVFRSLVENKYLKASASVKPIDNGVTVKTEPNSNSTGTTKNSHAEEGASETSTGSSKKRRHSSSDVDTKQNDTNAALPMEMMLMLGGNTNATNSIKVKEEPKSKKRKVIRDPENESSPTVPATGSEMQAVDAISTSFTPTAATASASTANLNISPTTLWMINWEPHFDLYRRKLCVKYSKERMGGLTAMIVQILVDEEQKDALQSSQAQPQNMVYSNVDYSKPLSLQAIYNKILALYSNNGSVVQDRVLFGLSYAIFSQMMPSVDSLKKLMTLMVLDNIVTMTHSRRVNQFNATHTTADDGPMYVVNISSIISNIKQKTIHDIICAKYGKLSGRIIQLLQEHKYMDQQRISDMAIIPARDAREKLYMLFK